MRASRSVTCIDQSRAVAWSLAHAEPTAAAIVLAMPAEMPSNCCALAPCVQNLLPHPVDVALEANELALLP